MYEDEENTGKFITNPKECRTSIEEFLQEFKDQVYPSFASFGFTFAEAALMFKLNCIANVLLDLKDKDNGI